MSQKWFKEYMGDWCECVNDFLILNYQNLIEMREMNSVDATWGQRSGLLCCFIWPAFTHKNLFWQDTW